MSFYISSIYVNELYVCTFIYILPMFMHCMCVHLCILYLCLCITCVTICVSYTYVYKFYIRPFVYLTYIYLFQRAVFVPAPLFISLSTSFFHSYFSLSLFVSEQLNFYKETKTKMCCTFISKTNFRIFTAFVLSLFVSLFLSSPSLVLPIFVFLYF